MSMAMPYIGVSMVVVSVINIYVYIVMTVVDINVIATTTCIARSTVYGFNIRGVFISVYHLLAFIVANGGFISVNNLFIVAINSGFIAINCGFVICVSIG
ncbi:hypothetical protein GCM10023163_19810 [Aestuariibaculum suncheonense]